MERLDEAGIETTAIAELLILDGKRVLDVGCGEGRLTKFAADHAASVYAFDPKPDNIVAAQAVLSSEQLARVRFGVHDAEALDLARERFDVALCGWSLWCVPVEGVVRALRNIHAVLVPHGRLVDTQPICPQPRVTVNGETIGSLDMHEWVETIHTVDDRVNEVIAAGFYDVTDEREFSVTSVFDDGPDCLDVVVGSQGTRVPEPLAERLAVEGDRIGLEQLVRLRVLRRLHEAT